MQPSGQVAERDDSNDVSGPWGPWVREGNLVVVRHPYEYAIPVADYKIHTARSTGFGQIAEKTRATDAYMAGLVRAPIFGRP
jgi:hypothetical protein